LPDSQNAPKTLYQVTADQSVISVVSHFCSQISFKYDTIFDTSKLTQTARTAQKNNQTKEPALLAGSFDV
jgi:hypothetical protein